MGPCYHLIPSLSGLVGDELSVMIGLARAEGPTVLRERRSPDPGEHRLPSGTIPPASTLPSHHTDSERPVQTLSPAGPAHFLIHGF